jgi:hypothetical protein
MAPRIHVCIDRIVPPPTLKERMALVKGSKWAPNDGIRISFMDGDPLLREGVKTRALEWTKHANLTFLFGTDPDADIRISFRQRGSWSFIGTQCHNIPLGKPTMNFGWLTPNTPDEEVSRVVLHEFGHALGCIHEHQNPAGGIQWNKPAVEAYYEGPPNKWNPAQVEQNLFKPYAEDLTVHTELDPHSIMMYPVPKAFTLNNFEVGMNRKLSPTDIDYISQQYP